MVQMQDATRTEVAVPGAELVISADSHAVDPPELWETRLPRQFQQALRDHFGERTGPVAPVQQPQERVRTVAEDGISAEVLYPNTLFGFHILDAAFQEAYFRVYNDWIAEYCQGAPDQLVGLGLISLYDIDHAVQELERCRKGGLRGALIWEVPPPELPFTSERYEPFWAAAQALEMPLHLHILTGHDYSMNFRQLREDPSLGLEFYRITVTERLVSTVNSLFYLVFSGVLERYPGLKLVLAENGIGWIPTLLERWDKQVQNHRARHPLPIAQLPSEYFRRQVFATFLEEPIAGVLLTGWGVDNCMWSTDYPHNTNTTWPHSREVIARELGHLPAEARAKVLWQNAAGLYGLTAPRAVSGV